MARCQKCTFHEAIMTCEYCKSKRLPIHSFCERCYNTHLKKHTFTNEKA